MNIKTEARTWRELWQRISGISAVLRNASIDFWLGKPWLILEYCTY
jgi:hypothetical protein